MREISGHGWQAVVSDLGAELQSLRATGGEELLWQGDSTWWAGRSPVLFPIVGRAAGDVVRLDDQDWPMAQHGFARRRTFSVQDSGTDFILHQLVESAETLAVYPRRFQLLLEHRLTPEGLRLSARVTNSDHRPLPFGLGFHPAFRFPLPGAPAGAAHEIRLNNGADPLRSVLDGGLLSRDTLPSPFEGGRLEMRDGLFDHDALIFLSGAGEALSYGVPGGPQIAFRFGNLPFLALWSRPGAPFLCVEPWHGAAAWAGGGPQISARPGTIVLDPGASADFVVHIAPQGL